MRVSDFDFELPSALIAKRPLVQRDASRLLVLGAGGEEDRSMAELDAYVQPGDIWVLNDTRVIPARLLGRRPSGGRVELLLLEPCDEDSVWKAWGKANKPLKPGQQVEIAPGFHAEILEREGKDLLVRLHAENVQEAIERYGHMPLPPYIDRPDTAEDRARYQTVFARRRGAVAAPTAGLHLTEALMERMRAAGAEFVHLTLHVGPGTFQPVQVDEVERHRMHEESYEVPEVTAERINRGRAEGRRIVAVGTTSLRTLEAAGDSGCVRSGPGRTSIFIYPGYRFRIVDALLTNFHLPRSTLLMLVCAMAGRERVLRAYDHAIRQGYRFYSYGDAMLVDRHGGKTLRCLRSGG